MGKSGVLTPQLNFSAQDTKGKSGRRFQHLAADFPAAKSGLPGVNRHHAMTRSSLNDPFLIRSKLAVEGHSPQGEDAGGDSYAATCESTLCVNTSSWGLSTLPFRSGSVMSHQVQSGQDD